MIRAKTFGADSCISDHGVVALPIVHARIHRSGFMAETSKLRDKSFRCGVGIYMSLSGTPTDDKRPID